LIEFVCQHFTVERIKTEGAANAKKSHDRVVYAKESFEGNFS
jgi:hypothetical protein